MKLSDECESDNVKAGEEILETLDKLIIKEITSMDETPLSWNGCLKDFYPLEVKSMPGFKVFKDSIG